MAVKTTSSSMRIILFLFSGALKIIIRVRIAVGGGHRGGTDKTADEIRRDDDIIGVIAAGAVPDHDIAAAVDLEPAIGEQAMVPFDPVITSRGVDVVAG